MSTGNFLTVHVPVPDEGEQGPAMKALKSDRQRLFVLALVERGGKNATAAAIEAGYGDNPKNAKVVAHRLVHDELVIEAMREEAKRRLDSGMILASSFLVKIIEDDDPLVSTKDKLKAVDMLMARTGMGAVTEHKVSVEHKLSDKEVEAKIAELAKRHGLDPVALLGQNVVDAEFEVIEPGSTEADQFEEFTAL